ncbi:MAG: SAM-dependent chlorinase/fluorinase, partial [Deltaproteobacteria bacterium]|nr:SAM-dependent chlorinase/fluorinase [Deltaproteobacteria bacterium]
QAEIVHVTKIRYFLPDVSHTFHGRDIFAPVAAHISRGVDPREMGSIVSDPVQLEFPVPEQRGDTLYGRVMRIDHFGNLITNIHKKELEEFLGPERSVIMLGKLVIEGLRNTYSDGCLEIAVNTGRASDIAGTDPDGIIDMEIEVRRV